MFKKYRLVILFIFLSLSFVTFSFYSYQLFYTPNILLNKDNGTVYIPKNATINQVVDSLKKYDYVNDVVSFMFVSKLLKYNENVKPGKYELKPEMNNLTAVRYLRSGQQEEVNVTFSSVRTVEEALERLCKNIIAEKDSAIKLLFKSSTLDKLSFTKETIPALFLPNTYSVFWNTDEDQLIKRLKIEYDRFWNTERKNKAEKVGLTPVQVTTIASLVNAETNKKEEWSTVAGIYINRLNRGMALESCPTIIYALGDFSIRRVLDKHLKVESPYNTYKYTGLPPGPINIPSPALVDAVLNYEKHKFLYMCAKEDFSGFHHFSSTYKEHLRHAKKYQRALDRQ